MASDRPELDDILAHSRIHDWISEQYEFALSEQDIDAHQAYPSLRESCVLPADFEPYISPVSVPHVRNPDDRDDEDNDGRHSPFVDSAHEYLVQEMNSWSDAAARNKPLPTPPPAPYAALPTIGDEYDSSSSPSASPRVSRRSLPRMRPILKPLSTSAQSYEPELDEDEHRLTTSASYASLRNRTSHVPASSSPTRARHHPQRFPSISTTMSGLPPLHSTPTTTTPTMASTPPMVYTPTTPTSSSQMHSSSAMSTPPLTHSSSLSSTPSQIYLPSLSTQPSMPSLSSKPSEVSLHGRPSIPELHTPVDDVPLPFGRPRPSPRGHSSSHRGYSKPKQPNAEQSRWSVATSTDDEPPAMPSSPLQVPDTPSAKPRTFRKRILSTISRLSKKSSVANMNAAANAAAFHSRSASEVSSAAAELGYLSSSTPAAVVVEDPFARSPPPLEDPFARMPPVPSSPRGDYADFLARTSAERQLDDSSLISSDMTQQQHHQPRQPIPLSAASYMSADASYISADASYISADPSYFSAGASYLSLGGPRSHQQFLSEPPTPSSLRSGGGNVDVKKEKDEKRKNRLSWASAKGRAPRRKLLFEGLTVVAGAKIGEVRPETLFPQEQAVYVWCEGFGEIRKTTRTPDGAIAVEWRSAGVAENVCERQTSAHIPGAGIVSLTLIEGKRKLF